jgi:predicted dehydrogenase
MKRSQEAKLQVNGGAGRTLVMTHLPSTSINRRQFLRRAGAAAGLLSFPLISRRNVLGANARLNVAAIGAGGKGAVDIGYCAGENVVALCDVDQRNAAGAYQRFAQAKRFKDFRVMLDQEGKQIDAVTISSPDHTHFHPAVMAMKMGKHVYLQKPLTHTVWEARKLTELARETKVVTQMGNQGHCENGSRRLVELIRAGVLGEVREIHVWTDRPIWPQGMGRPAAATIPEHLDWDLWLGPAPHREFHEGCVPFNWRAFWDFGTGALGDMGCHNMDLAFFALDLRDPEAVSAESSGVNAETAPRWSMVTYEFPRNESRGPVRMREETRRQPGEEI